MNFENEPLSDKHTFKPRQFRLTLTSQDEVDALLILADDTWYHNGIVKAFLVLLGRKLRGET